MPLLSPQRSSVLTTQTRGSSDVKWISNAHLIAPHIFSLACRRWSWRVCHERKHTSALLVIGTLLLASQLAGRASRTTFSMFTNISTSPWCHHLIRSLAPLAPLWQPGEHRLTKPVSLRYNLDLRLEAEQEEWQRSHITTSLFCRAPEFSLVKRNNELMRWIKNTGYLKVLLFPNLADIFEQWKWYKESEMSPWFHQTLLEATECSCWAPTERGWEHDPGSPWPNLGRHMGAKSPPQCPDFQPFLRLFSETAVTYFILSEIMHSSPRSVSECWSISANHFQRNPAWSRPQHGPFQHAW